MNNYYCIYCEPVGGLHEESCKLFDRQQNNQVIDGYGKILEDLDKLAGRKDHTEGIEATVAKLKKIAKELVEQPEEKK